MGRPSIFALDYPEACNGEVRFVSMSKVKRVSGAATSEEAHVTDGEVRSSEAVQASALRFEHVSCSYGKTLVVRDVHLEVPRNQITALIGPSGCGKSTLLRSINRMNDLVPSFRMEGSIFFDSEDISARGADVIDIRRRVGMVFQKPNPFPKSIFENVAFGPRLLGQSAGLNDLVEESLHRAALWDEVKDKLGEPGLSLSGGQQQRLCIARAIAVRPEVILMDEPCSALDPRSTLQIEELMRVLAKDYTIVIVTHNMQQASRASDQTIFMTMGDDRAGYVVEYAATSKVFTAPEHQLTADYVSGRFG
jgi:phosphate transport system ATP-binding protein